MFKTYRSCDHYVRGHDHHDHQVRGHDRHDYHDHHALGQTPTLHSLWEETHLEKNSPGLYRILRGLCLRLDSNNQFVCFGVMIYIFLHGHDHDHDHDYHDDSVNPFLLGAYFSQCKGGWITFNVSANDLLRSGHTGRVTGDQDKISLGPQTEREFRTRGSVRGVFSFWRLGVSRQCRKAEIHGRKKQTGGEH